MAVRGTASPWPLTRPALSVMDLRTRVLAPPVGSSPFDPRAAAPAVVTTAAVTTTARHRGGVPFIRSSRLGMTVIVIFAALANRLPRRLL